MTTAQELAKKFNLTLLGDNVTINGITSFQYPQLNYITPILKVTQKIKEPLFQSLATGNCFLLPQQLYDDIRKQYPEVFKTEILKQRTLLLTNELNKVFIPLLNDFNPYIKPQPVISLDTDHQGKLTAIGTSAVNKVDSHIASGVFIGSQVVIGNNTSIDEESVIMGNNYIGTGVKIGRHVVLHPNTVIHHGTVIGDHSIIHAGTVVGSDGFGYERSLDMGMQKIPQIGNVIIGKHVEIGSNCSIDRATLNFTKIGDRVKVDNLVQIGHNVVIGNDCIIVSQTGIAGSCIIGNRVIIGGQVGIADHVTIEDDVQIAPKSGIYAGKTIPAKSILRGVPAIEHVQQTRIETTIRNMVKKKKPISK